jgi:hypothetical protein
MHTLKTPHATVFHHRDFSSIEIKLTDPAAPLDIMDIQEIYGAFFRQWLAGKLENMAPHDLIRLGTHVSKEFPG